MKNLKTFKEWTRDLFKDWSQISLDGVVGLILMFYYSTLIITFPIGYFIYRMIYRFQSKKVSK